MYSCKILADSVNNTGDRLVTFELTYPLIIHAEFLTHRSISRNAASNRAIPVQKLIDKVRYNPFIPDEFPLAGKGMQPAGGLGPEDNRGARLVWMDALAEALRAAEKLKALGVHKQIANRLLGPFQWMTVIASGTTWANFFHLRTHKDAQKEIRAIAEMMAACYEQGTPQLLEEGQWHLPLLQPGEEELPVESKKQLCTARCARVSYLTHDGTRDLEADYELHNRLKDSGHWSPFEHVARTSPGKRCGNFSGWFQYRFEFQNQNVTEFDFSKYKRLA